MKSSSILWTMRMLLFILLFKLWSLWLLWSDYSLRTQRKPSIWPTLFYRIDESTKKHYSFSIIQFSSVAQSCLTHELQHAQPPYPSLTAGVYPNPCPLSRWCRPTISSSVIPLSSCPQSFPASGSSQMSQLFISGGQSIGVSASTSVLPRNTQDWSPLGWTGWTSLQSKGLSWVFNNTVQKHLFFSAQLSL